MAERAALRKIGNSVGVIIPKSELDRLHVSAGDEVFLVQTTDGLQLTPYDPDFAEAMEAGRKYMDRHRDALKELAK